MKNFVRALRDALEFWPTLLLATFFSFLVAANWGGNIAWLYPIFQVTFAGKPLQPWIADEIDKAEVAVIEAERHVCQLSAQLRLRPDDSVLQEELHRQQEQIRAEQKSARWFRRFRPWVDRLLPHEPFQTVVVIVVVLVAITLLRHVFLMANTFLVARAAAHIARRIRMRIFQQAMEMDQAGFTVYSSSSFTTHIAHTTEMLSNGIVSVYGGAVREPLKLISCLVLAGFVCWRLVLISLVVVPISAILIMWVTHRIKNVCRGMIVRSMGFHHIMLDAFANLRTVQAYSMEHEEQDRFGRSTYDMLRFSLKTVFYNALTRPITELLGIGMVSVTIVISAYLVLEGQTHILGIRICDRQLTIPSLLVFFGLLVGATDPVRKLSTVFEGINMGIVAADVLYPLLDRQAQIRDPVNPVALPARVDTIEFRDVTFAYQSGHNILTNVSLKIPRGGRVAVVGPNGAGKSSFVNLLCRFYDPQGGEILFDGKDLRTVSLKDLRRRIGLVTQQTELFNENVAYNIRYGAPDATQEQIEQAARTARAHDFITQRLPQQYETRVGQLGHCLSGGQRQRIALARAFLRNPEILILDEATSQIDAESERLIHNSLEEFCQGRTVFMITHKMSMMELADIVLEFDNGRVTVREQRRKQAA